MQVSDEKIKEIAEYIIRSHAEDIEYLSITEMTDDQLDIDTRSDDLDLWEERQKLWERVDSMVSKAKVTITFED